MTGLGFFGVGGARISVNMVEGSICRHIEESLRSMEEAGARAAVLAGSGGLPCRRPLLPPTPDLAEYVVTQLLPSCIMDMLNECRGELREAKPTDLWILYRAMLPGETPEEAEKYWVKLPPAPAIVLRVERGGKAYMFLLYVYDPPVIGPYRMPAIGVLGLEEFMELYGPGGNHQPNLLARYKHYRIVEVGGVLDAEEEEDPY